jgi:hypothetical protein
MQIPLGKPGANRVLAVDRPSEAEENAGTVPVLKIQVFLVIENRLLRDVLAHLLRRQGDIELTGKGGYGETNPEEAVKRGCDVAILDFSMQSGCQSLESKVKRRGERSRP